MEPITVDPVLLLRTCAHEFGKVKASNSPRSRKAASLMTLCHDTADALEAERTPRAV